MMGEKQIECVCAAGDLHPGIPIPLSLSIYTNIIKYCSSIFRENYLVTSVFDKSRDRDLHAFFIVVGVVNNKKNHVFVLF